MVSSSFLALIAFCFVASITPGPNNMMLMASGANFGVRRTLPHMAGVGVGFLVMVLLVGTGIMALFDLIPAAYTILKIVSVGYLLYLATKIARAGAPEGQEGQGGKPLTFLQAAAFQWVNPKAWAMALSAVAIYAPSREIVAVIPIAMVFGFVSLVSISFWVAVGQQLKRLLTNPWRLRLFNGVMALLLVASVLPMIGAKTI
ncbi:transporter, LysE family protein [Parvularcula bermudensis HTCC2503]|uniref:Transporter, LysE family protein n=1 Tax=Parvularcula bermudensis (strain ATCC BAA-594 / HTCC2503 / KCTC 12087) TaxID=314260 RepID=E0TIC7_PARBH|nr:LysE family translocator [Parvularcula bermudensis]ADM09711.1 transporter, LysE family protein [Parvularcula bermudensis HTCC2503]